MTTWNYRIIHELTSHDEHIYSISEVYYKKNGEIEAYTDHMYPMGETILELKRDLDHMQEAFTHPVLELDELETIIDKKMDKLEKKLFPE